MKKKADIQIHMRKRKTEKRLGIEELFCYLAEVFCLAVFLTSACSQISPLAALYGLTGCFAVFLWCLHRLCPSAANWFDAVVPAAAGLFLYYRWETLYPQFWQIGTSIVGTAVNKPFLEAAIYAMLVFAYLVFLLELRLRRHAIFFILNGLLLWFLISWRVEISAIGVVLFLIAQFGFFALPSAVSQERKKVRPWDFLLGGLPVSVLCVLVLYAVAARQIPQHSESLFQGVYALENHIYRTAARIIQSQAKLVSNGKVSRGNNYQTGASVLELHLSDMPSEYLYLKGFNGGAWQDEEWQPLDETELLAWLSGKIGWVERSDSLRDVVDYMCYEMTDMAGEDAQENRHDLDIYYLTGDTDIVLQPYFSSEAESAGKGSYHYQYYEASDVQALWDMEDSDPILTDWYFGLQSARLTGARQEYTEVPEGSFEKLAELCEANPLYDVKDITAFIMYTLREKTSYSTTPGRMPQNENIVEYFLFERQKGYCVHYASTAVMMYRLYGIPARYVSGYVASPRSFVRQENGDYVSVVPDESAHAWVEIFLFDYGWIPIEVTPGFQWGKVYPGFERTELEKIIAESNYQYPDSLFGEEDSHAVRRYTGRSRDTRRILTVVIYGLAGIFLAAAGICGRRYYQKRKRDCLYWYSSLLRSLHAAGRLRGYDGSEKHFPELMAMEVKAIPEDQVRRLVSIVSKVTFSPERASAEEERFVRETCQKGRYYIRKTWPWYKGRLLRTLFTSRKF